MESSASSTNKVSRALLVDTLRCLIDSVEKLTTSVEELKHTISKGNNANPEESASVGESVKTNNGAAQCPWTRISILEDAAIAMEEKKDAEAMKAFIKSASNGKELDPWKSLPFVDWNSRFQMGWVSKHERESSKGGRLVPGIISYYSSNIDERLSRQNMLFFGLSTWWWHYGKPSSNKFNRIRGTLDMGPLVSLIGMRLPGTTGFPIISPSSADLAVRILVEMLRISPPKDETDAESSWKRAEGAFWANTVMLGDLFDRCYERKVFPQPNEDDLETHLLHATYTMNAMKLMNFWSFATCTAVAGITSVNELRSLRLSDVWWHTQRDPELPPPFEQSVISSFRSRELYIETIRKVSKLQIEWTPLLDEHLELDIEDSTLKVFWFGFAVKAVPIFHIGCYPYGYFHCHTGNPSLSPLFDELQETYSLLFRSQGNNYHANIAEYGLLPVPEWLRVLYADEKGLLPEKAAYNMSYFTRMKRPWLSDMESHTEDLIKPIPDIQLFDKYKAFGGRLRMLKAYLDSQRPGGIRGLCKDNRDSLAWYTFWAVIFIGGIGLVLSLLSLVATVAQTSAAFRSLYTTI